MTRYVGVDQSLVSTAMVSLDDDGEVTGIIDQLGYPLGDDSSEWKLVERASLIAGGVVSFINDSKFSAIEGYSYGSKGKRLFQIAELGGIIRFMVDEKIKKKEWKNRPFTIPPKSVKKFATGNGNSDKSDMKLGVYKRWGFEHKDDNVVDAYAIAQMMRYSDPRRREKGLDITKYQMDTLNKCALSSDG